MNQNNNNLSPHRGLTPTDPIKESTKGQHRPPMGPQTHRRTNSDAGPKRVMVQPMKPARSHENLSAPRKQAWQHMKYNEYKVAPYNPVIDIPKAKEYKSDYQYKGQKEYQNQAPYQLHAWNYYMIKGGGTNEAKREREAAALAAARKKEKEEEKKRKREEERARKEQEAREKEELRRQKEAKRGELSLTTLLVAM